MQQRYKGVKYPIVKSPTGYFSNTSDLEQIKSDLLTIICTIPGERIMEPGFGTALPLLSARFSNQLLSVREEQARMMIARSIKKWEKRVQVTEVKTKIFQGSLGDEMIRIEVHFIDPIEINTTQKLTLEKPLIYS